MGDRQYAAELAEVGQCRLGLRVPIELRERLNAEADSRDVSVNWLVTKLVTEGLDRITPASEMRFTRER